METIKKNKNLLALAAVIIVVIVVFLIINQSSEVEAPTEKPAENLIKEPSETPTEIGNIILFYGQECSHCKDVEKFLEDNKIIEKVKYQMLEVWYNKDNQKILSEKVAECKIDAKKVGVPFLYADGKCLIGTPDIEKFFKEKAGL